MHYNVSQLKANVCIIRNEHPTRAHALASCTSRAHAAAAMRSQYRDTDRKEDFLSRAALKISSRSASASVAKYSRSALLCASKVDRFAQQRQQRRDRFTGKSAEGRKTITPPGGRASPISEERAAACTRRGCLLPSRLIYLSRPNSTSRRKCDKTRRDTPRVKAYSNA
ncbi:hypothetical protein DBV15_08365 [Temnothorax longispinosus]|uniref:Uncharacterized protein n=1 Tax=Temnothorax longispinosus TaxID=300112 RepID=A0A4S2KAV5_9HYME|nr:hypothetical protein DBV15_08365 [Temnothorax longispinosus]